MSPDRAHPLRFAHRRLLATVLAGALTGALLAGCTSYSLNNVWKEPAFKGPPVRSLMVIGVSQSDVHRRLFEDGFVQTLKAAGKEAQPSYTLLPQRGRIPDADIKGAIARTGVDAVIVTRVLRVDKQVSATPMGPAYYGRGFYGWYGSAWATPPMSIDTYNVLTIETTLFDAKADKPIWTATTETFETSDVAKATQGLSEAVVARLKQDGMI